MKRSAAYADREAASTNENVPYGRLVVSQATTRTEAVAQRGPEPADGGAAAAAAAAEAEHAVGCVCFLAELTRYEDDAKLLGFFAECPRLFSSSIGPIVASLETTHSGAAPWQAIPSSEWPQGLAEFAGRTHSQDSTQHEAKGRLALWRSVKRCTLAILSLGGSLRHRRNRLDVLVYARCAPDRAVAVPPRRCPNCRREDEHLVNPTTGLCPSCSMGIMQLMACSMAGDRVLLTLMHSIVTAVFNSESPATQGDDLVPLLNQVRRFALDPGPSDLAAALLGRNVHPGGRMNFRNLVETKVQQRNARAHISVRWLMADVTLQLVDVSVTLAIVQSLNVMEISAIHPALGADVQRAKESLAALVSHVGSLASRPLLLLPSLNGIAYTQSAAALYRSIAENAINSATVAPPEIPVFGNYAMALVALHSAVQELKAKSSQEAIRVLSTSLKDEFGELMENKLRGIFDDRDDKVAGLEAAVARLTREKAELEDALATCKTQAAAGVLAHCKYELLFKGPAVDNDAERAALAKRLVESLATHTQAQSIKYCSVVREKNEGSPKIIVMIRTPKNVTAVRFDAQSEEEIRSLVHGIFNSHEVKIRYASSGSVVVVVEVTRLFGELLAPLFLDEALAMVGPYVLHQVIPLDDSRFTKELKTENDKKEPLESGGEKLVMNNVTNVRLNSL